MEGSPNRLARGERRIVQILDAAAVIFARVGVERATTNAIAAEAGISPGSLYQFFRDKADIAAALGHRYAEALEEAQQRAFDGFDPAGSPLSEVLDRTLAPIVAVKESNAAFAAMFARPDLPVAITAPVADVERLLTARIADLLGARDPGRDREELLRIADTVMGIVRGAMGGRRVDLGEIRLAILGYLSMKGIG